MFAKKQLLDSSSDEDDNEVYSDSKVNKSNKTKDELKINNSYAQNYDRWRSSEETQKLKDRYGEDVLNTDDSESSSEESDIEDEEKEKEFLKMLSLLKKKDERIYSEETFFKKEDTEPAGDKGHSSKSSKTSKPFLLKDHDREMILREQAEAPSDDGVGRKSTNELPYNQQLHDIKKGFQNVLKEIDSSDDEDGVTSSLLRKRTVTSAEKEKSEQDYRLWLSGQLENVDGKSKKELKELQYLKDFWNDPELPEDEKFLKDYVLNRRYAEPDTEKDSEYIPTYDEIIHDSDEEGISGDEKFESERANFEHKYNFRFEEPDQDFIKRYPRTVHDSLRRTEEKRKKKRQEVKEKKESKVERKREEVQRLKSIKRKEIMEKVQQLQEITGESHIPLWDEDLDGDFDPDEHDRRMAELFDDNYYGQEEGEKPVFPSDDDLEEMKWDEWVPEDDEQESVKKSSKKSKKKKSKRLNVDGQESQAFNTNTNLETDKPSSSKCNQIIVSELIDASKSRNRKTKSSVFLEALERKKPKFDPSVHDSFQQYFDEYYQLDFEDLVGDLPCRFKYRKVTPNDFGLTTEEILEAPDRELNTWASVKKTFQYRPIEEEVYEVQAYQKKAKDLKRKKRIFLSLYDPESTNPENKVNNDEQESANPENEVNNDDAEPAPQSAGKKKRKKKNKKKNAVVSVDDDRLLAYGINPKKLKKRMVYGGTGK